MKKLLLIFVLSFTTMLSMAQTAEELRAKWENTSLRDSIRFDALHDLIWIYYLYTKPDSARILSEDYRERALEVNDINHQAISHHIQGSAYSIMSMHDSALSHYNQSIKLYVKANNWEGLSGAYNNLGVIYQFHLDYANALDCYHRTLKINQYLGKQGGVATAEHNIALVYTTLEDFDVALEHLDNSLRIIHELDYTELEGTVLGTIGITHQKDGRWEESKKYLIESVEKQEQINNQHGLASSLTYLSECYLHEEKFDSALVFLEKAKQIQEELGAIRELNYTNLRIGDVFFGKGDMPTALQYYTSSLEEAQLIKDNYSVSAAAEQLYLTYKKLGRTTEALEMFEIHASSEDSLMQESNQKAAIRQQIRGEFEKQSAVDQAAHQVELQRQKDLAAARDQQNNIIIIAISIGLLLVALFLVFLYNRFRLIRSQKVIIEEQKQLVEEKNQEVTDSINYAFRIQQAILPTENEMQSVLSESFVLFKPKDIVSGDFYWIGTPQTNSGDNLVVFAVCDCTGHGVPGGFLSMLGHNYLHLGLSENSVNSSADALNYLHTGIVDVLQKQSRGQIVRDGMDIALCAINRDSMKLEFAGAKNPAFVVRGEELFELKGDKMAIGDNEPRQRDDGYTNQHFELQKGDCIYMTSDGYPDQFGGPKGKKFKAANLKKLLLKIHHHSMSEQKNQLEGALKEWQGSYDQIDDICILGVRV